MNITTDEDSTLTEYTEIFNERGLHYHKAMKLAPHARDCEFQQIFVKYPFRKSEQIIDAPSGGGYLERFLQACSPRSSPQVKNLEFTSGFGGHPQVVDPYGNWPISSNWADRSICLAACHHIADLTRLLENFRKHSKSGALIQLADVDPDGGISTFLDSFVDAHTCTGHKGIYRNFSQYNWPEWIQIHTIERRACPWVFSSEEQMLQFCHGLFGLNEAAKPLLLQALKKHIGISPSPQGIELQWELVYVDGKKK